MTPTEPAPAVSLATISSHVEARPYAALYAPDPTHATMRLPLAARLARMARIASSRPETMPPGLVMSSTTARTRASAWAAATRDWIAS